MGSWCSKEKVFQGRIQEFFIEGEMGGRGPNFGSERTVELFLWQMTSTPPPQTPSHQLRLYVAGVRLAPYRVLEFCS